MLFIVILELLAMGVVIETLIAFVRGRAQSLRLTWYSRLKYIVAFIVLLVLYHFYRYSTGRYHPHEHWGYYKMVIGQKGLEMDMVGKWIIPKPTYDSPYSERPNINMEGWEESEYAPTYSHYKVI